MKGQFQDYGSTQDILVDLTRSQFPIDLFFNNSFVISLFSRLFLVKILEREIVLVNMYFTKMDLRCQFAKIAISYVTGKP